MPAWNKSNDQTKDSGAIPVRSIVQYIPDPDTFETPPPATIAGGGNWQSGPIDSSGFNAIAVSAKLTQAGSLSVQRYIDVLGTIPISSAISAVMSANTLTVVSSNDDIPFACFIVTVSNTSGSTGTLSDVAVLEKAL
jgi:hypothetical protein